MNRFAFVAVAILMGVLPNLFLRSIEPSVNRMLNQVQQGAPQRLQVGLGIRDSGFGIRESRLAGESQIPNPESRR